MFLDMLRVTDACGSTCFHIKTWPENISYTSQLNVIYILLGVLSKIGGVRKYRKISDIQGTLNDTDAAFGKAIDASQRKKTPGCK